MKVQIELTDETIVKLENVINSYHDIVDGQDVLIFHGEQRDNMFLLE